MRRWLNLGLAVMLVFSMSFAVLAEGENGDDEVFTTAEYEELYGFEDGGVYEEHFTDNGVAWETKVDRNNPGAYTNLEGLNRSGYYLDNNSGGTDNDQEVAVKLNVDAYIPCYLELTLTGNQGTTSGQSFGPNTNPNQANPSGYLMVFDNEIGGFVDEDWMSLGGGRNAEVEPGPNTYIQACDIFKVDIYGNEAYKYEVESDLLSSVNAAGNLAMQMGTSLDAGDSWGGEVTFDTAKVEEIATGVATESISALHRFRVPYNRDVVHGRYNGTVIFRAVSIQIDQLRGL